jgi:hypothetical protein
MDKTQTAADIDSMRLPGMSIWINSWPAAAERTALDCLCCQARRHFQRTRPIQRPAKQWRCEEEARYKIQLHLSQEPRASVTCSQQDVEHAWHHQHRLVVVCFKAASSLTAVTSPVWGFSHPARLRVMMAILKQGGSGTPRNLAVR